MCENETKDRVDWPYFFNPAQYGVRLSVEVEKRQNAPLKVKQKKQQFIQNSKFKLKWIG